jgi:hypothetical protein
MNRVKKPETINICDEEYSDVRAVLVKQAKKTMSWMQEFILSEDVFVSRKDYFLSLVQTWGDDPCI